MTELAKSCRKQTKKETEPWNLKLAAKIKEQDEDAKAVNGEQERATPSCDHAPCAVVAVAACLAAFPRAQ